MRYQVLGPLTVTDGDQPVLVRSPKQRRLLAALLLNASRVVSVPRLIDAVWDDRPPGTATTGLQGLVSQLRRALATGRQPGSPLHTHPGGYLLAVAPGELDAQEFESLASTAHARLRGGDPQVAARLLRQALALWQGPALGDVDVPDALRADLARLAELRVAALEDRIDADLALGGHPELIAELDGLVAAHPHRERLRGQHMLALYRSGRRAEALASYRAARGQLVAGIGIEPGPELRALLDAVLADDPDLSPAPNIAKPGPAVCQLPPDIADFTSRARAVRTITELAYRASTDQPTALPIVCVYGKPGVGKTALAVRIAHQQRDRFPDGQLYVNLRGAADRPADPGDVLADWLRALGVDGQAIPTDLDGRTARFRSRLDRRRMLVVLDNAADEAQVRPLLPGNASCLVLVTSRRRLAALEGAVSHELDELPEVDATELLGRIIGAARVAAEPVAALRIVRYCGRLPLAVRISGARLALRTQWTLPMFADRLADERRRLDELAVGDLAVRASLELSYRALAEPFRRALRLLGLWEGADLTPAVAAALLDVPGLDAVDVLDELVDAQLLATVGRDRFGQARYRFHDLLGVYARERLAEEEPADRMAEARDRADRVTLALAELAAAHLSASLWASVAGAPATDGDGLPDDPDLVGRIAQDPVGWFTVESANLVRVTEAAAGRAPALAWQLAINLAPFLELQADWALWRRTQETALAAATRTGDQQGVAHLLRGLGCLAVRTGDPITGTAHLQEAVHRFQVLGNRAAEAESLRGLAVAYWNQGRLAETVVHLTRCLTTVRSLGDRRAEARTLYVLALTLEERGQPAEAAQARAACLHGYQVLGDRRGQALVRTEMGRVQREAGNPAGALEHARTAVALFEALADRREWAFALYGLASAERELGELAAARAHFQSAHTRFAEVHDERGRGFAAYGLGLTSQKEGRLDEALAWLTRARQQFELVQNRSDTAQAMRSLAEVHLALGARDTAVGLLRAAVDMLAELDTPARETEARQRLAELLALREDTP